MQLQKLKFKRGLLALFFLLQAIGIACLLLIEYQRIMTRAASALNNTAVLLSHNMDLTLQAMSLELRVIGHSTLADNVNQQQLTQEIASKAWLDAVFVLDHEGTIIRKASELPFSDLIPDRYLQQNSLRNSPVYQKLVQAGTQEDIYYPGPARDGQIKYGGFYFYRVIHNDDGQRIGSVIGLFSNTSLQRLIKSLQKQGFDPGHRGGFVIYDRHSKTVLYRFIENGDSSAGLQQPYWATEIEPMPQWGHGIIQYRSPVDYVLRLGAQTPLNNGKWEIQVGESLDELLLSWRIQLLFCSVAFLLIMTMQWTLLNFIHRNQQQREQLAYESMHDTLTGLANRRHFAQWSSKTLEQMKRFQQPLCILSLDLDFFKRINDTHGHDGGDAVLKQVGKLLQDLVREYDLAARFGGEEFIIAMPQTSHTAAMQAAERIRAELEQCPVPFGERYISITASIGVAEVDFSAGIEDALSRADLALYQAKNQGRNCVVAAPDSLKAAKAADQDKQTG